MLNKCTLIGNLGKDPELSYTPSQKAVCKFSLATKSGKDVTEWHNIVVWEKQAEDCAKYLTKGKLACVEGRIATRSWVDKEGRKIYTTEIIAHSVLFLSPKGGDVEPTPSQFPTKDDVSWLDDAEIPF